jgi:protein-tyrosine phosphatase
MSPLNKIRVLFVCMGNICRSPTAEGVFRTLVEKQGLSNRFEIDSAGTTGYHAGEAPDKRAQNAARKRGYDLSRIRARQVNSKDFSYFDYILAMDKDNLAQLKAMMPGNSKAVVRLFLDYAKNVDTKEVPDPYYGGADGFEHVLDLIENASVGFLKETY